MTDRHRPAPTRRGHDTGLAIGMLVDGCSETVASVVRGLGHAPVDLSSTDRAAADCVAALIVPSGDDFVLRSMDLVRSMPTAIVLNDTGFPQRLKARQAGVDAVLKAPLEPIDLYAWLRNVIAPDPERPRVLIVDDDPFTAEASACILEAGGMTVHAETQPSKVLERIASERPDVLLLDMNLPGMTGIDVATIVRDANVRPSMPILFLTGERSDESRIDARRAGGDEFIDKRISHDALIDIVHTRAVRARGERDALGRDEQTGFLSFERFVERASEVMLVVPSATGSLCVVGTGLSDAEDPSTARALANALRAALRASDVLGRTARDEFSALLPGASPSDATGAMARVRDRLGSAVESGLSAGIVGIGGDDIPQSLKLASGTMRSARALGRDRTVVASLEL